MQAHGTTPHAMERTVDMEQLQIAIVTVRVIGTGMRQHLRDIGLIKVHNEGISISVIE